MNEIPNIITERVDDIPLLLEQMQRMGLPTLLDNHFPTHGNWTGLSLGWVSTIWLSSMLSRGDHRMVHVDSTSASVYATVSEGGLFQFGHSKDDRPDLPQVKVMQAVLDPLGMPLATDVVSGERADDPLYMPCIERVQASVGRHGLL